MKTFVLILQIISCIGLICTVLLQTGHSEGLGTISGAADKIFGSANKGMDELMAKISTGCAIAFMILTVILCIL